MRKSRFSEEQIATALRQVESNAPVAQVSRRMGVSEATFYLRKKQFAHLSTSELREVRQLREENTRLKRLMANLTLDKVMLQSVLEKKADGHGKARVGPPPGEAAPAGAEASIPVARFIPIDPPLRVQISR